MAIYLVGDIQGCYNELQALLEKVAFNNKKDQLYVAGDLVARGPDSLATLRLIKSLKKSAKIVLGNHDLHLLAIYAGIKKAKPQDNLAQILAANDADDLMNWLAQQPLLQQINNENAYMSHAGIAPQWNLKQAIKQANFVHDKLRSNHRNQWLSTMYGEMPNDWHQAVTQEEQFRYTINAFTRMRYCYKNKHLEFNNKSAPYTVNNLPDGTNQHTLIPWFELSETVKSTPWVFGHWAALMGKCSIKNVYALDTGCVWGKHLTMLRWHDKKIFTEQSHKISL